MFFAPYFFFWGGGKLEGPKILDLNYLIEHTFHHRAKFRGDRPTELGDFARRKKLTAKH